MNVLLINGSPHEKGCTYTALSLIAGELNKAGYRHRDPARRRQAGGRLHRLRRLPQRQWLRVRRRGQRGH